MDQKKGFAWTLRIWSF